MKFLVAADDSGSLKEIVCNKGTDTSSQTAPQPLKLETFASKGLAHKIHKFIVLDDETHLAAARADGSLEVLVMGTYESVYESEKHLGSGKKFVSLFQQKNKLYLVSDDGTGSIFDITKLDKVKVSSFKVAGPVATFVPHPSQDNVFAFGGKENDVKIISLDKKLAPKTIFQAKNVSNTKIDLRVPVDVACVKFLDAEDGYKFITLTKLGEMRKYDTKHGRKPVFNNKINERALHRICINPKQDEFICADVHCGTMKYNMNDGRLLGKYGMNDNYGMIEDVAYYRYAKHEYIVIGGLDRYIRVYDYTTREILAKVYTSSKVSQVVMLDNEEIEVEGKKRKLNSEENEKENEELWEMLETEESQVKKSKKSKK